MDPLCFRELRVIGSNGFGVEEVGGADGNKRLALAGVVAFYGLNGRRRTLPNDAAYDLVIAAASGQLDSAGGIAKVLSTATTSR